MPFIPRLESLGFSGIAYKNIIPYSSCIPKSLVE
jgi:hypothetical protein